MKSKPNCDPFHMNYAQNEAKNLPLSTHLNFILLPKQAENQQ